MEKGEETFCKLCFNSVNDGNFKVIEETTTDMLNVLLLRLNVEEKIKPVICSDCYINLFEAFKFKITCKCTEYTIFPYITLESVAPIDLREVYLSENDEENSLSILESEKICRLCMEIVTDGFTPVNEVEADVFLRYIPEVNFNFTKEPLICLPCFKSLITHSSFLKKCLDVQEKTKISCQEANPIYVKAEEVEIKSEYSEDSNGFPLIDKSVEVKTKDDSLKPRSWSKIPLQLRIFKCGICNYTSKCWNSVKFHQQTHKGLTKMQICHCDTCGYKIKGKNDITKCSLRQEDLRMQMYKCNLCGFKTVNLKRYMCHLETHKVEFEVPVYICGLCNYRSKFKIAFTKHQLVHKDTTEVPLYKCDMCNYETKHKEIVKRHQLIHEDFKKKLLYNCNESVSKTKGYPVQHQLRYKSVSVRVWTQKYKCDLCDFRTSNIKSYRVHQLLHGLA